MNLINNGKRGVGSGQAVIVDPNPVTAWLLILHVSDGLAKRRFPDIHPCFEIVQESLVGKHLGKRFADWLDVERRIAVGVPGCKFRTKVYDAYLCGLPT